MATKLTLSADKQLIRKAKRVAARSRTSVSSLFGRLIRALDERETDAKPLGPITLRATGLVRKGSRKTDRQLLEDALADKYGL